MKITLGKVPTETSLYVTNGKTEIQLDDAQDNFVDVKEGGYITIFTKQVTEKEVRNSLMFFPFHLISAIIRCIFMSFEKDYVEKRMEPYAVICKYMVSKEDMDGGIKIDFVSSGYRAYSNMILDAKLKINNVEQDVEQIPNPLQSVRVLNSFCMDMGWLVGAISALGIYCIIFGTQHLNGRGVAFVILGCVLVAGVLSAFAARMIADKKKIKRMKELLKKVDK